MRGMVSIVNIDSRQVFVLCYHKNFMHNIACSMSTVHPVVRLDVCPVPSRAGRSVLVLGEPRWP